MPTLTAPPAARTALIARSLATTNPTTARTAAERIFHRPAAEPTPTSVATTEVRRDAQPHRPRSGAGARLELSAKTIKLTVSIDPAALVGFVVPEDRIPFRVIAADGRKLTGELRPRGIHKVQATLAEHGAEAVAVVIQGVLGADGGIEEAGLVAQVKGPKP